MELNYYSELSSSESKVGEGKSITNQILIARISIPKNFSSVAILDNYNQYGLKLIINCTNNSNMPANYYINQVIEYWGSAIEITVV